MIQYQPVRNAEDAENVLARYRQFENAVLLSASFTRDRERDGKDAVSDLTLCLLAAGEGASPVTLLFTGVTGAALPDLAAADTLFSLYFSFGEDGEILCMEDPEQDPENGLMITASGLFFGEDRFPRDDRNPLRQTEGGTVDFVKCDPAMLRSIEEAYGIRLPGALVNYFTVYGIPRERTEAHGFRFPHWYDFSPANVAAIKRRMEAPYRWLKNEALDWYWNPAWGEAPEDPDAREKALDARIAAAPVMLPFFSHRCLPLFDGNDDPPVLSTVGSDTIVYGKDLRSYLEAEFGPARGDGRREEADPDAIPFWNDILKYN